MSGFATTLTAILHLIPLSTQFPALSISKRQSAQRTFF